MSAHSPASRCFISLLLALLLCIMLCESCYRKIFFFFFLKTLLLSSLPFVSIQVFPFFSPQQKPSGRFCFHQSSSLVPTCCSCWDNQSPTVAGVFPFLFLLSYSLSRRAKINPTKTFFSLSFSAVSSCRVSVLRQRAAPLLPGFGRCPHLLRHQPPGNARQRAEKGWLTH